MLTGRPRRRVGAPQKPITERRIAKISAMYRLIEAAVLDEMAIENGVSTGTLARRLVLSGLERLCRGDRAIAGHQAEYLDWSTVGRPRTPIEIPTEEPGEAA